MLSFSKIDPFMVLYLWAMYKGDSVYRYLANHVNRLGYRMISRYDPEGRELTEADLRRFVQRRLSKHPRYPIDRIPTNRDLQLIKADYITSYKDDIV